MSTCSPALPRHALAKGAKGQAKGTCYGEAGLAALRTKWNLRHPDDKIASDDPQAVWKALRERLRAACKTEACWLRQEFARDLPEAVASYTFAPPAPAEWRTAPSTWLTSDEITAVMKQYEHHHPSFAFLGPSPIDFDKRLAFNQCVWADLCAFDANQSMSEGHTQVGIVFNLDSHDLEGSHWVALYLDLASDPPRATYMDSYGEPAPKEVDVFVERVGRQLAGNGRTLDSAATERQHQRGDSECGVYSLYFIISMLTGAHTRETFSKVRIPDNKMRALRKVYFQRPKAE